MCYNPSHPSPEVAICVRIFAFLAIATLFAAPAPAAPVVFEAAGGTAGDIQAAVDGFRNALGTLNANNPVNFPGGRREINWDGVPDALSDPNLFPGDFFNGDVPGRARGIEFTTPGSGLQTSSTAASGEPIQFGFGGTFETFSPERLFTPIDSNTVDVSFFDPARQNRATTSTGFGAVFTDVDLPDSTSLTFFDKDGAELGSFFVPPSGGSEGFSFLGAFFSDPVLARVRIASGSAVFNGQSFGAGDEVVMDDFIYGEPVFAAPIPVPAALWLSLAGFGLLAAVGRRRT